MRFVIFVAHKGYLEKGSHTGVNYADGYEPRYTDDLQRARLFGTLGGARNCKVSKYPGAEILSVVLTLV